MVAFTATPVADIPQIRKRLFDGFATGKTKSVEYRRTQLLQLAYMVQDHWAALVAALKADLGRPEHEAGFLELNGCVGDALHAYENIYKWTKPEKPGLNKFFVLRPVVRKEPKGVALIIGPFNYPVWCLLSPAIGAIAAGCAAVLKPSELTPHVSALLAEIVPQYLDPELFAVVNGSIPETTALLDLQWDHIFYTGSGRVGRIIASAAAKHLTPVTLELGGKSPVVIDPSTDMSVAARRILWGKAANAGQTCVAPDYVLVPRSGERAFLDAMAATYKTFYPEAERAKADTGRIVSDLHWDRLTGLLARTEGKVLCGGTTEKGSRYIAPTIVEGVKPGDALLESEIFGPILPVVAVEDVDEAVAYINAHDRPLAEYVFSRDKKFQAKVFDNTQSGAASANEVLVHVGVDGLPFGGTGPSGSGYHTGEYGYREFTHLRAEIDSPSWFDKFIGGRFPPYTADKLASLKGLTPKIKYARPGTAPAGNVTR